MSSDQLIISRLTSGIKKLNTIKIPKEIINIAKNLIIDISGVTFAGSRTKSASLIYNLAEETYLEGNCEIIGMKKKLNPAGAAFVNGAFGHSLDFDDNCYAGVVHGSSVVFPAVLACAQQNKLSGAQLLKSFIIGLEIQFAVAKAFSNDIYHKGWWTTSVFGSVGSTAGTASLLGLKTNKIYHKGWWTTSVFGSVGSTAGTASLLGLKTNKIKNALSISLSGVGAVRAIRGTNAKHYYCGKSAENGILSSNIAKKGATGPNDVFEDRNGILKILNDNEFNYEFIKNIGEDFSLLDPGVDIKKYPVCYASHAAADGINSILKSKKIKIREISQVICTVPPIIASNLTYNNPKTVKEAQFSMQFSIAMIIKFGSIKLNFLDDQYISDEDTKKLMEIIDMRVGELPNNIKKSEIICPEWSNVKLFDKSGNCYEKFVGAPIGSAKKPLDQVMLFNKFKSCIEFSGISKSPDYLYNKLINIEEIKNCRKLF